MVDAVLYGAEKGCEAGKVMVLERAPRRNGRGEREERWRR